MRSTFFHSLKRNQDMLAESLNLDQNDDIVTRSFTALGRSCALYFVEGMASGQRMSDSVLASAAACAGGVERAAGAGGRNPPSD